MVKRAGEKGAIFSQEDDGKERLAQPQQEVTPKARPDGLDQEEAQKILDEVQAESDAEFMERYTDVDMNELIMQGYVSHTAEICKDFSVTLRTLKKKEELDIKDRISGYEGVSMYILDQTNANTLAYCIMELNGTGLPDDFDKRREIIDNLSDVITVAILDEFRDLNKALVIMLKGSSKNSLARRLFGQESI